MMNKRDKSLVTLLIHASAHMVISHRNNPYLPLGQRMKKWIKGLRNVQFLIRVLEINAAIGSLVLLILITNIDEATGWIMRISVRRMQQDIENRMELTGLLARCRHRSVFIRDISPISERLWSYPRLLSCLSRLCCYLRLGLHIFICIRGVFHPQKRANLGH